MAELKTHPKFDVQVTLTLNGREALALAELSKWSNEEVINSITKGLNTGLLDKHKEALHSFLDGCGKLTGLETKINKATDAFHKS